VQLIGRCQFTFDEQTSLRESEPFLQKLLFAGILTTTGPKGA
jgi:hypothetical protein